jgi:small multidrug resistance pump
MVFIGESVTAAKIIGVLLVISGVVVLNTGGAH